MARAGTSDHGDMHVPLARTALVFVACTGLLWAQQGEGASETPSDFVRFVDVGDGGRLETAITTYRSDAGIEVVLYGAVHTAEPVHFEVLQERFRSRQALLYELVAQSEDRPSPEDERKGGGSAVSLLQRGLKNALGLQFQLDVVDYRPANFVHADMEPEEFAASMKERGESLMGTILRMARSGMAQATDEDGAPAPTMDFVSALRSGDGKRQLKLMLGRQLEQMERMALGLEDKGGSTLLEGRNEKCLTVLQQRIDAGDRRIGIYYGAAHLPHMEQRLVKDLGFRKTGHEWVTAWDCVRKAAPAPATSPAGK